MYLDPAIYHSILAYQNHGNYVDFFLISAGSHVPKSGNRNLPKVHCYSPPGLVQAPRRLTTLR